MSKILNPIHLKPTWIFARFPDDCDDLKKEFGDSCLALSDVEMIAIRVAVRAFLDSARHDNDARIQNVAAVLRPASEKICAMLNAEFEEGVE